MTIALWIVFFYLGFRLGMYFTPFESKNTKLEKQYAKLQQDMKQLREDYIVLLHRVGISSEEIEENIYQLRFDLPDEVDDLVVVPYDIEQNGNLVMWDQIWTREDWQNHLNPDIIWIDRQKQHRKGIGHHYMWIWVEDFDPKTDHEVQDSSKLPCKWEYIGVAEYA
jgi:hypothetical protein